MKINIIGASGTGKTTLAKAVATMRWTAGYDDGTSEGTNTLPSHLDFIQNLGYPILKLQGPMTTDDQIEQILRKLNQR